MPTPLENARQTLLSGGHCCVACKGTELACYDEHGIRPLLRILRETPEFLQGASVADKVIGRAAALLLAFGGAQELFACLLSETAIPVLQAHGIPYRYETLVPVIQNRDNTGLCPMEQRAQSLDTPEEAFAAFDAMIP